MSIPECGPGDWFSVIRFNVSDPDQTCPTNWQERTTPVRACERPMSTTGTSTCSIGFEESVSRPFTRVAGRAIGYQVGSPDAFFRTFTSRSADLEGPYVDGLSITYSTSANPLNNHIWTFAAGITESNTELIGCPCVGGRDSSLPAFLQDRYFCESGVPDGVISSPLLFDDDPLWDGENCEDQCCAGSFATVPTFCATVEQVEGATIRVRICTDEPTTNENIAIESLEIFVQ